MKTILVVEDDEQVAKVYEEALTEAGYQVLVALTADNAYTQLRKQQVDLVVLDIMLSHGANGFDVLETMKRDAAFEKIPVIVLTNLDSERKVALEIGASDYLVKSETSLSKLVEKVKGLLGN